MHRSETGILLTRQYENNYVKNTYRLIRNVDPFSPNWIYSIFLTTEYNGTIDEEFAFDCARKQDDAIAILNILCREAVSACTLFDVLHNLASEADAFYLSQ